MGRRDRGREDPRDEWVLLLSAPPRGWALGCSYMVLVRSL